MSDQLLWLVRILEALSLLTGVTIAYFAYVGFRRSRHPAVLLSALGFGLLSLGAAIEGTLFELFNTPLLTAHAFRAAITLTGFIILLMSIRRIGE